MDRYSLWEETLRKHARSVARDFPEVDEEDLFQDLCLWILQPASAPLVNPDQEYADYAVKRQAKELAWNYRKQALYITSQYAYRTSDVKSMLETLFDYDKWDSGFLPADAESLARDDRLVAHSDLSYAYSQLTKTYKKHIFSRFVLKVIPDTDGERKQLARAIEKMTDGLNIYRPKRDHQGPGARSTMGNSRSIEITRGQT